EHPDIAAELRRRGGDACNDAEDPRVDLPGVRLAADRNRGLKIHHRGHESVELANLLVVAVEELQKARLGSCRSLDAAEWKSRDAMIQISHVEHEILHPKRSALADRR